MKKIGQGREKARDFLKDNTTMLKKIETEVRAKIAAQRSAAASAAPAAAVAAVAEPDDDL